MALREAQIPIQFAGGINTKTDPKRVPLTQLLALQNAVFRRDLTQLDGNGTDALCKRNGYEALTLDVMDSTSGPSSTRALGVRDGELLLFCDDRCYSYSEALAKWVDTGAVASVMLSDRVVAKTGNEQTDPDSISFRGLRLTAWVQAGGVWWSVSDDATGRVIVAPSMLSSVGQRPRVLAVGEVMHVYWTDATNGRIYTAIIAPGNLSATPTQTTLVDDLSPSFPYYDVDVTTRTGTPGVIAWQSTSGVWRCAFIDASGALGGPGTGYPSAMSSTFTGNQGPIAIAYDLTANDICAVAVCGVDKLRVESVSVFSMSSLRNVAVAPPGTCQRITCEWRRDSVSGVRVADVAVESSGSTARDNRVDVYLLSDFTPTLSFVRTIRGAGLSSHAFQDAASVYAWACHDVPLYSTFLLVRLSDGMVAARYLPSGAAHGLGSIGALGSVTVSARVASWAATYNEVAEDGSTFTETGIRVASASFNSDDSHQSGQLGGCLYLAGGALSQYDGERWAEAGFHYAPDGVAATAGAGGSLTESSTYLYGYAYEETNARGEIDRGPINIASVVLAGGQTRVTLDLPTYRVTGRKRVRIAVFRSPANDDSAMYRVTSLDPSAASGSNRYVANDGTVDTVSFVDDMSDAVLITKEPAYTNGGIPSNDPIGGGGVLVVGKGRVFTTDAVDPLLVRYSQAIADGYAVESAPTLSIRLDPFGGPVTGMAMMDDALIVFKRDAMYMIAGDGPLANPDANPSLGFTAPQLITSDVGCVRGDSIGYTPVGLIFQSRKGIYLLGRDRQVQYIGAPVEAFNAQTVSATELMPDRTQIVLLTASGSTLMYDYHFGQWSTFTGHEGVDSVIVDGVYHYLRNDGRVFRETPGVYRDANAHIPMVIETAWIKLAGYCQGFQRIYHAHILGRYSSAHTLRLRAQYDYEDGWASLWDLDVDANYVAAPYGGGAYGDGPYGGDSTTRYQRKVHVGRKCQSVRFRFEDIEATDVYGASFELSELLVTGGVKRGAPKVGAARSD